MENPLLFFFKLGFVLKNKNFHRILERGRINLKDAFWFWFFAFPKEKVGFRRKKPIASYERVGFSA